MDEMRIVEETPARLVLEWTSTSRSSSRWSGCSKPLLAGIRFLVVMIAILMMMGVPAWVYWVAGAAILIVWVILFEIYFIKMQRVRVTIDLHSDLAKRVTSFNMGRDKEEKLALTEVTQVLLHTEEARRGTGLVLDSQSARSIEVASDHMVSDLQSLGMKLGDFLNKPVVARFTDSDELISEGVIQG